MKHFVVIDFETANPKRVSACSLGYVVVKDGSLVESDGFLIKPVGGHASFQTSIHGITKTDTAFKRNFGSRYSTVAHLFDLPIVGYSAFDKQVLNALSDHFDLGIHFEYIDCCALTRRALPNLRNHKLTTVAKHFQLPPFKHHDAVEDARACAEIFLLLQGTRPSHPPEPTQEFKALASAILEDDRVDYKEACQLLYWLEDHQGKSAEIDSLLSLVGSAFEDSSLEEIEGEAIRAMLKLQLARITSATKAEIHTTDKIETGARISPTSSRAKTRKTDDDEEEMSTLGCLWFLGVQAFLVFVVLAMFQPAWEESLGWWRFVVIVLAVIAWLFFTKLLSVSVTRDK